MNMMAKLRKFARHKYEEKLTRDVAMIWKKSNCNVEEAMLSRVSLTCKMSKSGDRIQVYESSRDAVLRKVKAERLFSRMLSLQTWSYANGLNCFLNGMLAKNDEILSSLAEIGIVDVGYKCFFAFFIFGPSNSIDLLWN
ncbi:unnamed protein product [Brassica oleracea var. botrytis]